MLTEVLTIAANEFLGVDPFLKVVTALAIVFMSFALVGLAIGLGARYPRFGADPSQVAGSYGGVAFMMQAVLFVIVMIGAARLAVVGLPAAAGARPSVVGVAAVADRAASPGDRLSCVLRAIGVRALLPWAIGAIWTRTLDATHGVRARSAADAARELTT